jgi:hypothetical protein
LSLCVFRAPLRIQWSLFVTLSHRTPTYATRQIKKRRQYCNQVGCSLCGSFHLQSPLKKPAYSKLIVDSHCPTGPFLATLCHRVPDRQNASSRVARRRQTQRTENGFQNRETFGWFNRDMHNNNKRMFLNKTSTVCIRRTLYFPRYCFTILQAVSFLLCENTKHVCDITCRRVWSYCTIFRSWRSRRKDGLDLNLDASPSSGWEQWLDFVPCWHLNGCSWKTTRKLYQDVRNAASNQSSFGNGSGFLSEFSSVSDFCNETKQYDVKKIRVSQSINRPTNQPAAGCVRSGTYHS